MKMTYDEVLEQSKKVMKGCHCCPVCNGRACSNHMPGPGAKGTGTVAVRNYDAWQDVRIQMDTLCANQPADTTFHLFGQTFQYPIFAGPVGHVNLHYGDVLDDVKYNDILVPGCKAAGIAAFTGDGMQDLTMETACRTIEACGGIGVPTIKPWDLATYQKKLDLVKDSGAFAVAMDVDAAGLPFLKNHIPPAGRKTEAELKEMIDLSPVPFIVKGIMTVKGAKKAMQAGAAAIVVSNHGGRVLDGVPATAEVLPQIVSAVDHKVKVFVDGGIRSGVDVFKALALGADAVLIARPYVNAVYGAQEEGIKVLTEKLGAELKDTMEMCGAEDLAAIDRTMIH